MGNKERKGGKICGARNFDVFYTIVVCLALKNVVFDSTFFRARQTTKFIVQLIASIASAILTALGATSCMGY